MSATLQPKPFNPGTKMTYVLIGCGLSGLLMFCLFFVLPNLDRLKEMSTGKKAVTSTRTQANRTASAQNQAKNPAA